MERNPTAAETALSNLFETRRAQFTERPLDLARASAFARFAANGLPHRRIEAYRYTDLRARLRALPDAAPEADPAALAAILDATPPLVGTHRVVIANGRYVPERSTVPAGISVASLLDPAADTQNVGTLIADNDDPLTLANASLFEGGAVIHVSGAAAGSIEILHVALDNSLVMGRVAMFVAPGGSVSVVERLIGGDSDVDNALTELTVGEGARVSWVRTADGRTDEVVNLSTLHATIAANARFDHLTVTTGHGLSRNQVFAHITGDEAVANFRAATVAIGKRHADNTLVLRHDALNTRSTEVFRSAVGEGGTAIVQGRIIVDPGAQKTDARMMSNALFLDESGEVVNKPELEIFADDVQCGHGATSGDIDDEMIFYLRARGIPERTARRLLVEAFVVEALDLVEDETLREALAENLRRSLDAIGGNGWTS